MFFPVGAVAVSVFFSLIGKDVKEVLTAVLPCILASLIPCVLASASDLQGEGESREGGRGQRRREGEGREGGRGQRGKEGKERIKGGC